jgi:serine/threonine protein phosphatase PrpC
MSRMGSYYGMTHVGLVRSNNEDFYISKPELGLYIVADGMGGAKAGELASRITVETVVAEMERDDQPVDLATLSEAIRLANKNVRSEADRNRQNAGMGTTCVAVLVNETKACIANVGDSRAYLRTAGELYCVTTDHTWVNEIGRGLGLTEEQLRTHPYRNVLTKAVGAEDTVEVETHIIDFLPGDILLLCSDGLHTVAGEEALVQSLDQSGPLKTKCEALIEAALEKGAPDNITAVLVEN